MTWKQFFTSSIGKKLIMGFTGLFLIIFLVVHAGINACIFLNDEGKTFDTVAHFMSRNWILRFLELGLFAGLILHIIQGILLLRQNNAARPIGYAVNKNPKSTWYSKSMGLLGVLILLFLVMHLSHFWLGTKEELYVNRKPQSLYGEMKIVFSKGYIVALYLVGLFALLWHLMHGFQSAFHTLGLNRKKYTPIINALGAGYSILIVALFALMPLAVYFKWIN